MAPETGTARWLGGKLSLTQFARGHRAGSDAVLLAAACPDPGAGVIADFGCGAGSVGLAAAWRWPAARALLIDNDEEVLALAARNIADNTLQERVAVVPDDILHPGETLRMMAADVVLTNPPFLDPGRARASGEAKRSAAHMLAPDDLGRWLAVAGRTVKARGHLVVIHRADALASVLTGLPKGFGGIAIMPILAREGGEATRILVGARRESRAPLRLLSPLVLHEEDGAFTPRADLLHRGEVGLCLWPAR